MLLRWHCCLEMQQLLFILSFHRPRLRSTNRIIIIISPFFFLFFFFSFLHSFCASFSFISRFTFVCFCFYSLVFRSQQPPSSPPRFSYDFNCVVCIHVCTWTHSRIIRVVCWFCFGLTRLLCHPSGCCCLLAALLCFDSFCLSLVHTIAVYRCLTVCRRASSTCSRYIRSLQTTVLRNQFHDYLAVTILIRALTLPKTVYDARYVSVCVCMHSHVYPFFCLFSLCVGCCCNLKWYGLTVPISANVAYFVLTVLCSRRIEIADNGRSSPANILRRPMNAKKSKIIIHYYITPNARMHS